MPTSKRERQRAGREARRLAARAAQRRAQRRRQAITAGVLIVVILGIGFFISRSGSKSSASKSTTTTTAKPVKRGTAPCPAADGSATRRTSFDGPPKDCLTKGATYSAVVTTDAGDFTIAFDRTKAPVAVNNFVFLSRYHAYDGVAFHRVIKDFVVQGGDVEKGDGTGGPGYTFADELPKPADYAEGSLAMANSGPNTNGSQFFVITSAQGAQTLLQAVGGVSKYTLFGKVTSGMDIVKKIEADGSTSGTPTVVHKIVSVAIKTK